MISADYDVTLYNMIPVKSWLNLITDCVVGTRVTTDTLITIRENEYVHAYVINQRDPGLRRKRRRIDRRLLQIGLEVMKLVFGRLVRFVHHSPARLPFP